MRISSAGVSDTLKFIENNFVLEVRFVRLLKLLACLAWRLYHLRKGQIKRLFLRGRGDQMT